MKKLNPKWFPETLRNGDPKGKEQYEQSIRSSATGLRRLREIIVAEMESVDTPKAMLDYNNAGWAYAQADRLGQLRVYQNLLKLLEFTNVR